MSMDAPAGVTRPICFLDIQIGETAAGRIKIELFSDVVPKCVPVGRCRRHLELSSWQDDELTAAADPFLLPCLAPRNPSGRPRTSGSYARARRGAFRRHLGCCYSSQALSAA